jgi:hypothetical protein
MRVRFVMFFVLLSVMSGAQPEAKDDFYITLERVGCLGSCPDYKITIRGSGTVRYEGHAYVTIEGIHETRIPSSAIQKLIQRLRDQDFFHWPEKTEICVDFPEVNITATLNRQRNHVLEGCNSPGKVLQLAKEIDRISGAERWVGKRR